MAKHSPTPWRIALSPRRKTLCILSDEAWICGELLNGNGEFYHEGRANAERIVHAVNVFEDLVSALKEARGALALTTTPEAIQSSSVQHAWAQAVAAEARARAALAKAEAAS
ncbi:hypothetical protein [Methylobacterium sp. Leaf106]|uniref:hypothetical protein n=1 Tax=Methylobacterium sp. Leaf106 TaxID=1736255 RepID=UPI000A5FECD8|nr:hypothetical protein [Methylobacterium sp. Leaf106]